MKKTLLDIDKAMQKHMLRNGTKKPKSLVIQIPQIKRIVPETNRKRKRVGRMHGQVD